MSLAVFSQAASWIPRLQLFFLRMEIHSSPNRAYVVTIQAGAAPPGKCREIVELPRVAGSQSLASEQNLNPELSPEFTLLSQR